MIFSYRVPYYVKLQDDETEIVSSQKQAKARHKLEYTQAVKSTGKRFYYFNTKQNNSNKTQQYYENGKW